MKKKKFNTWPKLTSQEVRAAKKVLMSNQLNYWCGNEILLFEKEFSRYINTKYAIALTNGTVALEIALKALNLNAGDEVIVTSRTFLASISSIINCGLKPVFADVDPNSQNIDIKSIKRVVSKNTRAIMCVHLAGWPCDMEPIMRFAKKKNFFVIEDCAQAHGAKYKGKFVGSIGDIGCWSFCHEKIMTTAGEGGMVTTNNFKFWKKMWSYKDHGKNLSAINKKKNLKKFNWIHDSFGTNYRMTEVQAAIGRVQLRKLNNWIKQRNKNLNNITKVANKISGIRVLSNVCNSCPGNCNDKNGCFNSSYKCYIFVKSGKKIRDKLISKINANGVPCYTGICPEVYLEKAFKKSELRPNTRLPEAKKLGETSIMFMCHPSLTQQEIRFTCAVLAKSAKSLNIK